GLGSRIFKPRRETFKSSSPWLAWGHVAMLLAAIYHVGPSEFHSQFGDPLKLCTMMIAVSAKLEKNAGILGLEGDLDPTRRLCVVVRLTLSQRQEDVRDDAVDLRGVDELFMFVIALELPHCSPCVLSVSGRDDFDAHLGGNSQGVGHVLGGVFDHQDL